MEYKDYYKILGVGRKATQDEIKRAWRKLARKFHPDVSKEADAEEKFKEMAEAYEVLKDPQKRAAYDRLGSEWKAGQEFHPPPGWDSGFEFSGGGFTAGDASAFSDFFESLFGRGFGGFRGVGTTFHARGQDHFAKVLIDIDDAYHGASRAITLNLSHFDDKGVMQSKQRTLNVHIPKGVKQGQHIRLAGQGSPGMGGAAAGDLYLEVVFRPHPIYRVEGRDLYIDLPVTPWEAALGASVQVPTPAGRVGVKIPSGSSSGRKLRLKGRGIPGKPAGDLYAVLRIVVPPAESEQAKELYRKMAQQMRFNPRKTLGG
jgi:curved DNA-binding protein